MANLTKGNLILALARTGEFNAGQILERVQRVFPGTATSKKSIYSVCCVAKVRLPGSSPAVVNGGELTKVLAEIKAITEPVAEKKTGTNGGK